MKAETITLVSQAILVEESLFAEPVNQILDILGSDSGRLGAALPEAPDRVDPFQPDLSPEGVANKFGLVLAGSFDQRFDLVGKLIGE